MEYPPLVAGENARFAVHFTAMGPSFKPVKSGAVDVILDGPGGQQTFSHERSVSPWNLRRRCETCARRKLHDDRPTPVERLERFSFARLSERLSGSRCCRGESTAKAQEETIAFLKEQQWSLDLPLNASAEKAGRDSFVVAGQIQPRAGGQGEVTAPLDGRLVEAVAVPIGAYREPRSDHRKNRPACEQSWRSPRA